MKRTSLSSLSLCQLADEGGAKYQYCANNGVHIHAFVKQNCRQNNCYDGINITKDCYSLRLQVLDGREVQRIGKTSMNYTNNCQKQQAIGIRSKRAKIFYCQGVREQYQRRQAQLDRKSVV